MSESIEKNEPSQIMPVKSEGEHLDVEEKHGNIWPLVSEDADEQEIQEENNAAKVLAEDQSMDTILSLESETKSDTNQSGSNTVEKIESNKQLENGGTVYGEDRKDEQLECAEFHETPLISKQEGFTGAYDSKAENLIQTFSFDPNYSEWDDSGTEEEQGAFMRELENFYKEKCLEFKPPKFYGEGLNCLKLWRAVTRLGGHDQVTLCKLWRQVGETFAPPKTCTTVSWTFRCFYEKALLEYEKHMFHAGELQVPLASVPEPISVGNQDLSNHATCSGRARRDSAARAMKGWLTQKMLGKCELGVPLIKDKDSVSLLKKDKHLKSIGQSAKKKQYGIERGGKVVRAKSLKPQVDSMVVDIAAPANWVKINVRRAASI